MVTEIEQDDLIEDFHRIKVKLSDIILEDVGRKGGYFNQPVGLCQRDIQELLERQTDCRTWNTKELVKPFPAPLPLRKKRS